MAKHKCVACGKRRANRDLIKLASNKHPAIVKVCIDNRDCYIKAKGGK